MATPTIASVSPSAGHTGGRTLVEIVGSGFRLPSVLPPVRNMIPEAPPSVRVRFGTGYATEVQVLSSSRLFALTPIHDPTDQPVDVVVENVDDAGTPIAGESVTRAAAWRFVRPNVTDGDSDLVRLVRAFVLELQRQITPNVVTPTNTDFDESTGDTLSITEIPKFPGLVVASTELEENDFFAVRDPQESENPDDADGFVTRDPPVTVDLVFSVVGVSNSRKELLNLAATTKRFFRKNTTLSMARDPNDASKGTVEYEMDGEDAPNVRIDMGANSSNLSTFALTVRVRGFDLEAMFAIRETSGAEARGPGGADEATIGVGKTAAEGGILSIERL